MWYCEECESYFDEPLQYNPEEVPVISWADFEDWCDFENEDTCPYCYSGAIRSVREDDDEEIDDRQLI